MDDNYQGYVNRVAQMTLANNYGQQLTNIQSSPKFIAGKPVNFPGYSIMTPPWEDESDNEQFYLELSSAQGQLSNNLDSEFFIAIPPPSFHLTIADLIWEEAYFNARVQNGNFDRVLIAEIEQIFLEYQKSLTPEQTLEFELLGLSIFPRALAVCLAPTPSTYEAITQLRQLIYQNKNLIDLGIEQQYDFVAHITLGYFGDISSPVNRNRLPALLSSINDRWLDDQPPLLKIKQVQLRKFENMIDYTRQADWPAIQF